MESASLAASSNQDASDKPMWVQAGIARRARRLVRAEADLMRYKAGWAAYLRVYNEAGETPPATHPVLAIARDFAPYVLAMAVVAVGLMSLGK